MIVQNAVTCLACGDFIVSKHRHDFVECTCGAIAVDGGQEYLRRVGDFTNAVDHSWEISDELYRQCADAVEEAIDTNRNKFGIANAVMRRLRSAASIIGKGEQRIIGVNNDLDEIMVEEADGTYSRYKKVIDDEKI
jgi:hypothetical protein